MSEFDGAMPGTDGPGDHPAEERLVVTTSDGRNKQTQR